MCWACLLRRTDSASPTRTRKTTSVYSISHRSSLSIGSRGTIYLLQSINHSITRIDYLTNGKRPIVFKGIVLVIPDQCQFYCEQKERKRRGSEPPIRIVLECRIRDQIWHHSSYFYRIKQTDNQSNRYKEMTFQKKWHIKTASEELNGKYYIPLGDLE